MTTEHDEWDRWKRIRSGGRARYVWLYGVCGWGLSFGCLMTVFTAISLVSSRHPVPAIAGLCLLLGPVGGYFFGIVMWNHFEARFLAVQEAAQKEQKQVAALDALASEVRQLRESLNTQESAGTPRTETGITELGDSRCGGL